MKKIIILTLVFLVAACDSQEFRPESIESLDLTDGPYQEVLAALLASDAVKPDLPDIHPGKARYNREAIIPAMCYTRTETKHNPCYVCHQDNIPERENHMNDRVLQSSYEFSEVGLKNHWANLFLDRSKAVAEISDDEILDWINQDNYSELASRLKAANFKGWIPDLEDLTHGAAAFDNEGFALDNSQWVAFSYKPFPSTFWPTNGSTDDVMIRLPEVYRSNQAGEPSREIYKANLAILEANIKGMDVIESLPIDERAINMDLDGDGLLGTAYRIVNTRQWVGAAENYYIDRALYPAGTEFLHTVRYVAVDPDGVISPSKRMKEVRYLKKWKAFPKQTLQRYYEEEAFEKEAGFLPGYTDLGDYGLDNGMGWSVQGFIENANGRLRAASHEETMFCMGCHTSIGSTVDKVFSFVRKVDGAGGWGYIDLRGMPDASNVGENKGEILTYFERVGGGDEFRSNDEMMARWFTKDGQVDYSAVADKDVYQLITPSPERALKLNKAYKLVVDEQSYIFGRDTAPAPLYNVHQSVDETTPTLSEENTYDWNIQLQW